MFGILPGQLTAIFHENDSLIHLYYLVIEHFRHSHLLLRGKNMNSTLVYERQHQLAL